jgi:hypothetical protein
MSNEKSGEFKDVINFVPAPVMNIQDWETYELHGHRDYFPILSILLRGPMTVRDLTAAYNEWCKERGSPKPKSDKTIYRYLKTLGEHGLVVPAGKRVVFGKTATETLYARAAAFIRYYDFAPEFWEHEISRSFSRGVTIGTERLSGGVKPNVKCLKALLIEFIDSVESYIHKFVTTASKEELEAVREIGENHFIEEALRYAGILGTIVNHPELVKKLNDCFS